MALLLPVFVSRIGTQGLLREVALVGVSGGLSAAVYLALSYALHIEELHWLGRLVRQRLKV